MGSEATAAHYWILGIANHIDIDVFVHDKHREDIEKFPYPDNINFIFRSGESKREKSFARSRRFDKTNRLFIAAIEDEFIRRMESGNYRFAHFLSPAGIHSYNSLHRKAEFDYVIGPLGGGLPNPPCFGKLFPLKAKIKNEMRQFFYRRLKNNPDYIAYIQNASRIIIGTEYLFDYLPESVYEKTVVYFDTLVELNEFSAKENAEDSADPRVRIVFTARLFPQKGVGLLVEAIHRIKTEKPELLREIKVEIFGDGPMKTAMERRIKNYGIDGTVKLYGRVLRSEVITRLNSSDIFCLPTIREPGCQAILEAMAAGLPVITSDYGGPKYSVSDECGIKIPVDNYNNYVRNLANAIIKLAGDESLRKSMGIAAKERVRENFSLEALRKAIPDIYGDLLKK